jgi:hypothetical protein
MSIEQLFNNTEPQYENLWEFAILPEAFSGSNALDIARAYRMRFLVSAITLPFHTLSMETTDYGRVFVNGMKTEGGVTATFLETKDFTVYNYFKEWINKIYDPEKRVFKKGDYRRTGIVTFLQQADPIQNLPGGFVGEYANIGSNLLSALDVGGTNLTSPDLLKFRPSKIFKLEGLRPTEIDDISLSYTGKEQLEMKVSFELEKTTEITSKDIVDSFRDRVKSVLNA